MRITRRQLRRIIKEEMKRTRPSRRRRSNHRRWGRGRRRLNESPYLEYGSIGQIMDLDPEEYPEVEYLNDAFSSLTPAQQKAIKEVEMAGYEGEPMEPVLQQVGPANFLAAYDAADALRSIEYGAAEELDNFYYEVATIAKNM